MKLLLRLIGALLLAAGAIGLATSSSPGPAGAEVAPQLFTLAARADGFGIETLAERVPLLPGGQVTYVTPSSAQASLDQFSSSAFAAAPSPGDSVIHLPTTVNGLGSGSLPPVPAYPLFVASDSSSSPDAEQALGPYVLSAHSGADRSTGEARIGLSTFSPEAVSLTSFADVTRDPETGELIAEASTRIAPFRLNELVSIGEISSHARLRVDPAAASSAPEVTQSVDVGSITVAGIKLGLTEHGLELGSSVVPVDLGALTALLEQTGVQLDYLPGAESDGSVLSAALAVSYTETLPDPLGVTTVRFILGRSSASLSTTDIPLVGQPAAPTDPSSGGDLTPTLPEVTDVGGAGGFVPAGPQPTLPLPASRSATGRVADVPTISTPVAASLADLRSLYLLAAGGGVLALSGSRAVQWLAFRARTDARAARAGGARGR